VGSGHHDAIGTVVRIYAVQQPDTFRWTVVERAGDGPDLAEDLRKVGFDPETCRLLTERVSRDPPHGLLVHAADAARPLVPEGWRYDGLTHCWRAPGEEMAFCGQRWVRIMCDVCADGVWDIEGASAGADDLPITLDLLSRLWAWQAWYDRDYDEEDHSFDREAFAAEGLATARAVKAELPDWTVIYFDERRLGGQPRSAFEHEILTPEAGG